MKASRAFGPPRSKKKVEVESQKHFSEEEAE
jgi:hypothetical protein